MATTQAPHPWHAVLAHVRRGTTGALRRWAATHGPNLGAARVPPRDGEPYGRRVLSADAQGEIMLAAWRPYAACAPHDHGRARGMVVVLEGELTETALTPSAGGLRTGATRVVSAGDVLQVSPGTVHEMRAHAGALTLHVYVPGVRAMRVYDRDARATLQVADGCGAWVPADPSLILRSWPWDARADRSAAASPRP
jgi:quercetin dioxygenase-like cupin family protein